MRKLLPEDDLACIRRDAVLLTNKSPSCVRKELNPDSVWIRIFKERKISAVSYYSHKKTLYIRTLLRHDATSIQDTAR